MIQPSDHGSSARTENSSSRSPTQGRRLLSNAGIYGLGTILQRGLGFILLPFVTRILGVREYGVVGTALAVAAVLAIIYNLGMTFSVVRLYYDEPEDARRSAWAALIRVQVLIAAGLSIISWVTGPYWIGLFKNLEWGGAFQFAVVYSFGLAVQQSAQSVLRAARRPKAFLSATLTSSAIGGILGLVLARDFGAAGYLAGLATGALTASALAFGLNYRKPLWRWGPVWSGLVVSVPFVFHQLATWIVDLSDRFLIERYLGLNQVATYQVAYVLASVATMALNSLNAAWAPYYYGSLNKNAKRDFLPSLILPVNLVFVVLSGILLVAAPFLLRVAAPPEFGDPRIVLALVASATSVKASYLIAVTTLFDAKDSRSVATSTVSAATINIALNIALIPVFGINAAAASTVAALGIQALVVLRKASRQIGRPFPLGRLGLVWALSVAVFCGIALLPVSGLGLLARFPLVVVLVAGGWRAARAVRGAYENATSGTETGPPEYESVEMS